MMQFEEFSNVHNSDRISNATRSNLRIKLYKNNARSRLFRRITKRSTRANNSYVLLSTVNLKKTRNHSSMPASLLTSLDLC